MKSPELRIHALNGLRNLIPRRARWSVRNAERLTKTSRESGAQPPISRESDPTTVEEPILSALLGRKVTVTSADADESYTITITCESQKDIGDVVGTLKSTLEQHRIPSRKGTGDTHDFTEAVSVKRNTDAYGPEPEPGGYLSTDQVRVPVRRRDA